LRSQNGRQLVRAKIRESPRKQKAQKLALREPPGPEFPAELLLYFQKYNRKRVQRH